MIDFIAKYWMAIGILAFVVVVVIGNIIETREANRRIYLAQRKEEVSRISDGVAGGILAVFTNEEFLQALRNGAYIKIDINVDGSQNIVIAGNQNQVS
nr:hypothetical protein [uncultured Campylobacter sp.]